VIQCQTGGATGYPQRHGRASGRVLRSLDAFVTLYDHTSFDIDVLCYMCGKKGHLQRHFSDAKKKEKKRVERDDEKHDEKKVRYCERLHPEQST